MTGRKILLTLLLTLMFAPHSWAQTTVKEMRRRVNGLQQQIKEKERILLSSEKDVASKLKNLNLLTARIDEQKKLISLQTKEVTALEREISTLAAEIAKDEAKIEKSQKEYAGALRRARRYGTLQDKLLFIVSANDFNTMLRRYRYTRQYMNAHRKLAEQLREEVAALNIKREEVEKVRATKLTALEEQKKEQEKLSTLEEQQRALVAELKKENKKVKEELTRQRKELNNLNAAIEREIERELEKRRREEALAAKERAKNKTNTATKGKETAKATAKDKKATAQKDEPTPKVDRREEPVVNPNSQGMKKLTGSFLQNKGRLPAPITGPYMIVGQFGLQRGVTGKGNVQIDYGGITLQGKRGAQARAVFDGVVTSVVRAGDFAFIIVRHGTYLTVYCKIENIKVAQGDKVKTGDILADVATDASGSTTLLFQLRNEKTKLNPRPWLNL